MSWEGKSRYRQEKELDVEIKNASFALAAVTIALIGVLLINAFV